MFLDNNKTQIMHDNEVLRSLYKLVSNNWIAYIVIFLALLAAYMPALHAYYLHTDDYFWSYWGGHSVVSIISFMSALGRPLSGILFLGLKFIRHVSELNLVRFLSFINITVLAFMTFYWLRINRVNALLSLLVAIMIVTLPPFQVYISYFTTAPFGLAASIAMFALLLVYKSEVKRLRNKCGMLSMSVLLLVIALSLYQITAFYYWIMVSVIVLRTKPEDFVKEYWKKITLYFFIFAIAVGIYYIIWRLGLWYFDTPIGGKYDARRFVQDPISRIIWFFKGSLFEASNLWNVNPTHRIALFVGGFTILGVSSDFFIKRYFSIKFSWITFFNTIIKVVFLLSFFPAGYILLLANVDPSLEYRTYIALSSLFVIFVFLGCYNLVCAITSQKIRICFIAISAFIAIFSIFMANYTVTNYFVIPDSLELRHIKSEALYYQRSTGKKLSSVNIVRLAQSLAPTARRNEIGEQSAQHGPNIRPMVMAALSELGVSSDLRVTFSDSINAPTWTEHERVLVNICALPVKTVKADRNATIIDMSRLITKIK